MKKNIITSALDRFEVRRRAKAESGILEREVAGYSSESDRRDFEAMLDRYPDEETVDLRRVLVKQAA